MKKFSFIIFTITFLILPVFAAEWEQIDEKEYIDISSIQEYHDVYSYSKNLYNRQEKTFWIKALNDKSSYFKDFEKNYNKKIWYTISKNIVDCRNKTIAMKTFSIYDINGELIDRDEINDISLNRSEIIPESRGEYWYSIVCSYSTKKE